MNYKFPSFDATEFAPFEKKGFELGLGFHRTILEITVNLMGNCG